MCRYYCILFVTWDHIKLHPGRCRRQRISLWSSHVRSYVPVSIISFNKLFHEKILKLFHGLCFYNNYLYGTLLLFNCVISINISNVLYICICSLLFSISILAGYFFFGSTCTSLKMHYSLQILIYFRISAFLSKTTHK
jgi:hypothetical protein